MATLAALLLLGPAAPAATPEEQAVAMIAARGGKFTRDELTAGKPIVKVDLSRSAVSDADLARLRELKQLTELNLSGTGITDEGLYELRKLIELRTLDLSGTTIGDPGLDSLEDLTNLRSLNLKGTRITRKGLASLCKAVPRAKILR
jgi:hypothetical protein